MADRGEVKIRQGSLDKLVEIYKQTYLNIVKEINDATAAGKIQRFRVMARINKELEVLGIDVDKWVQQQIPQYYLSGANDALQDLREMGVDVSKLGMASINKEAISVLTDDVSMSFADGITSISRNARRVIDDALRQQINSILAMGKLEGETRVAIAASVKELLTKEGLGVLTDRGGKTWSFDTYANMLVRTKAVEARNQGLANMMLQNGYDLVQVSNHNSDHPACADWEGEVLSLTGNTPDYATLQEAIDAGLFHPNCQHAINVLVPELAAKTEAYDNPFNE